MFGPKSGQMDVAHGRYGVLPFIYLLLLLLSFRLIPRCSKRVLVHFHNAYDSLMFSVVKAPRM